MSQQRWQGINLIGFCELGEGIFGGALVADVVQDERPGRDVRNREAILARHDANAVLPLRDTVQREITLDPDRFDGLFLAIDLDLEYLGGFSTNLCLAVRLSRWHRHVLQEALDFIHDIRRRAPCQHDGWPCGRSACQSPSNLFVRSSCCEKEPIGVLDSIPCSLRSPLLRLSFLLFGLFLHVPLNQGRRNQDWG